jgi:hypothetical protein
MAEDTIIASAVPVQHPPTEHGHQVPSSETEINPKLASDIHYWTREFKTTGQLLHEAIRVHGTKVAKVRRARTKTETDPSAALRGDKGDCFGMKGKEGCGDVRSLCF